MSLCFVFLCFLCVAISATTAITRRVAKSAAIPITTVEAMTATLSTAMGSVGEGDSTREEEGVEQTSVENLSRGFTGSRSS